MTLSHLNNFSFLPILEPKLSPLYHIIYLTLIITHQFHQINPHSTTIKPKTHQKLFHIFPDTSISFPLSLSLSFVLNPLVSYYDDDYTALSQGELSPLPSPKAPSPKVRSPIASHKNPPQGEPSPTSSPRASSPKIPPPTVSTKDQSQWEEIS